MCVKCGVRVVGRVEAELREMNWFQRHLNWTALLALVGSYALGLPGGLAIAFGWPAAVAGAVTAGVVGFVILVLTWGWVLRRKNRSLWWLLLALFVPFGFLAIFLLENRSR